jgi:[ribulose-bisphosphate carboxylase]-lysine N-methyltransferase
VDKVAVADDIASDQPVYVAAKDIAAGDQVFAVPESAWITPATAQQSAIGKFIQSQEPWLQLALLLLAERAAGSSSKLGPYLTGLTDPSSVLMRSPLFWSEEELQLLQGTQLLESVRGYK